MGQVEIIAILEKSKVPLSARELAEKLNQREKSIVLTISQLIKFNEVKVMELNKDLAMKFFNCKRRMRLYYL